MGVEILSTNGATKSNDPNDQLKPAAPANAAPLPAIEKAAEAPDAVNEAAGATTPAGQTPNANGKKGKPETDKDASDSKHKPKKGLKKLNPF